VVSGGFPCQDISVAGKGAGIDGERSGLWGEMARIIGEVRPRFAFVENSPLLVGRGLVRVLADLAEMGFDAKWGCCRERMTLAHPTAANDAGLWPTPVAHDDGKTPEAHMAMKARMKGGPRHKPTSLTVMVKGIERGMWPTPCARDHFPAHKPEYIEAKRAQGHGMSNLNDAVAHPHMFPDADRDQHQGAPHARSGQRQGTGSEIVWGDWAAEPQLGRVAHGVAARVDRLKAIGNGQVPQCAAQAWRILTHNDLGNRHFAGPYGEASA
jgi:DNA (cytosine-5)-methyltransferase 1